MEVIFAEKTNFINQHVKNKDIQQKLFRKSDKIFQKIKIKMENLGTMFGFRDNR